MPVVEDMIIRARYEKSRYDEPKYSNYPFKISEKIFKCCKDCQENHNPTYEEILVLRKKLEDKEKELNEKTKTQRELEELQKKLNVEQQKLEEERLMLEKEKEELEARKKEVRQSLIDSAEIKMT